MLLLTAGSAGPETPGTTESNPFWNSQGCGSFQELALFFPWENPHVEAHSRDMLLPMQQSVRASGALGDGSLSTGWKSESSPASESFAGLLATLALPKQKSGVPDDEDPSHVQTHRSTWDDDGLEDDVTTLSYEHALRAHSRYRPDSAVDRSLAQIPDSKPLAAKPAIRARAHPAAARAIQQTATSASPQSGSGDRQATVPALERNLKSASITIRLSTTECAQLRKRAAEAGLTVSAYLRSCTFEAESLRAMVKDTLAQLQLATSAGKQAVSTPSGRSRLRWLSGLLPRKHSSLRAARA
jgi:hypothetical protein